MIQVSEWWLESNNNLQKERQNKLYYNCNKFQIHPQLKEKITREELLVT